MCPPSAWKLNTREETGPTHLELNTFFCDLESFPFFSHKFVFTPSKRCLKAFFCPAQGQSFHYPICPRMSLPIPNFHPPVTIADVAFCSMCICSMGSTVRNGKDSIFWFQHLTQDAQYGGFHKKLVESWLMINDDIIIRVMRNPPETLISPVVFIFFPACTWPSSQLLIKGVNNDNYTLFSVFFSRLFSFNEQVDWLRWGEKEAKPLKEVLNL